MRGARCEVRGARCEVRPECCLGVRIMATHFTELAAWQLANELRQLMLAIVARPNVRRDFKYCDQCKDADEAYRIAAKVSTCPGPGGKPLNMPIEVRAIGQAPA